MTVLDLLADPKAAYPPPDGRAWRVATCRRGPPALRGQMVTDLSDAHARKLSFDLYGPATAECVIDGRSPQCAALAELSQELVLYRWDVVSGTYRLMFRGPIGRTEDTLSETTHTVNVAASDLRAMLARRLVQTPWNTQPTPGTQVSAIFWAIMANCWDMGPPNGSQPNPHPFNLGLQFVGSRNPDGTSTPAPVEPQAVRNYTGAEKCADMADNLAQALGFDWSVEYFDPQVQPVGGNVAYAGIWVPQRGVTKSFVAEYGATVANLTRTVQSTEFANWVRNDGRNNADGTPMYAVAAGDVVTNPQLYPEGLWQEGISHSDVSVQTTLQQQANGELAVRSNLAPSYTVNLVPGAWTSPADCWLGDSIRLRIRSGRLNVDTTIRVLGVDFDISDSGQERVALTVGRPPLTFADQQAAQQSHLDALSRR